MLFGSCNKENQKDWYVTSDENLNVWMSQEDSTATFAWEGNSFENLIHGKGILSTYLNGEIVSQEFIDAYFGSIEASDICILKDSSSYIGKLESDLLEGFGVYIKDKDVYIGSFANSKPHGYLNWYKNNVLHYSGEWSNGVFHGKGAYFKGDGTLSRGTWSDGVLTQTHCKQTTSQGTYEGLVLEGRPDGFGLMLYNNNSLYDGDWKAGKWNGQGAYVNEKDSIVGIWKDGELNGEAVIKTTEFIYQGECLGNLPDGLGTLVLKDSSYYAGEWISGKRDGYGDMIYSNSDTYFGDWKDNLFNGTGRYIYDATGDYYDGEWKAGLQHGVGLYKSSDFEYIGNWEEGWMNGEGEIVYSNNDIYKGSFVENHRYGLGLYEFHNGNIYEGEFVDGKLNGFGTFYFKDGNIYEGEFQDGKIKGDGTLYYVEDNDSVTITAHWDGSNTFPSEASLLFANGDLYEGAINNGFPTEDGVWTTEEERENENVKTLPAGVKRANEFYKKHRNTWNKAIVYTSVALITVQKVGFATGSALAATVVGAPIGAVLLGASAVAGTANAALNISDALLATASAGVDSYEAIQSGNDPTEALTTLGTELAINAAFYALPKVIKSAPARKAKVVLSTAARNTVRNTSIAIKRNRVFGQVVRVVRNEAGVLERRFITSKGFRFYGRARYTKYQTVSGKQFFKYNKRSPQYISNLNEMGNSNILNDNMLKHGGSKMRRAVAREKRVSRLSYPNKNRVVCEAHHVVSGNSQGAKFARQVLKDANIGINDPRNGVFLPRESSSIFRGWKHGSHRSAYDDYVVKAFSEFSIKYKNADPYIKELRCTELLDKLKKELIVGDRNVKLLNQNYISTLWNSFSSIEWK